MLGFSLWYVVLLLHWSLAATGRRAIVRGSVAAEPRWPSVTHSLSTQRTRVQVQVSSIEINFSSQSTADRFRGFQFKLKVTFRITISNAIFLFIYLLFIHWSLAATGRRAAGWAKPAEKGRCTPLLTAKYDPDITLGGVLQAKLQPVSSL